MPGENDDQQQQTPTLEDVIDTAIADASPPGSSNKNDEGGEDDGSSQDPGTPEDDAGADGAAEAGAGGDADDQTGTGSEDAGAAKAGDGSAEDAADGKGKDGSDPAAAGGDAAAAKPGQEKPADKDGAAADRKDGAKEPAHVTDPIPPELKGKTRERMTALVDTAKTLTAELEQERGTVQGFLTAIAATGADPDTFARHVEVLRLMNSSDQNEQRVALKALRAAADKVAQALGEREPGKELEGHDDLAEEVEEGSITKARAIEIANARNRAKAEEARAARTSEQTEAEQAIATARDELNAFEAEMRKADPDYDRKRAAIETAAKALIPTIPPAKWKAAYKKLYDTVDVSKLPRPAPRVGDGGRRNVPRGTGANQPQRPRQGAGGGSVKAPTSDLEAVSFGIEQANARRG